MDSDLHRALREGPHGSQGAFDPLPANRRHVFGEGSRGLPTERSRWCAYPRDAEGFAVDHNRTRSRNLIEPDFGPRCRAVGAGSRPRGIGVVTSCRYCRCLRIGAVYAHPVAECRPPPMRWVKSSVPYATEHGPKGKSPGGFRSEPCARG